MKFCVACMSIDCSVFGEFCVFVEFFVSVEFCVTCVSNVFTVFYDF